MEDDDGPRLKRAVARPPPPQQQAPPSEAMRTDTANASTADEERLRQQLRYPEEAPDQYVGAEVANPHAQMRLQMQVIRKHLEQLDVHGFRHVNDIQKADGMAAPRGTTTTNSARTPAQQRPQQQQQDHDEKRGSGYEAGGGGGSSSGAAASLAAAAAAAAPPTAVDPLAEVVGVETNIKCTGCPKNLTVGEMMRKVHCASHEAGVRVFCSVECRTRAGCDTHM